MVVHEQSRELRAEWRNVFAIQHCSLFHAALAFIIGDRGLAIARNEGHTEWPRQSSSRLEHESLHVFRMRERVEERDPPAERIAAECDGNGAFVLEDAMDARQFRPGDRATLESR